MQNIIKNSKRVVSQSSGSGIVGNPLGGDTTELAPVIARQNNPPGSPLTGDRYLVDTVPTGVWVGFANNIAEWNGSTWVFTIPVNNNTVFVTATLTTLRYNGTAWVAYNGTAILQNGNTLGTNLSIGSNDNFDVILKRNNVKKVVLTATGIAFRNTADTFQTEFQNTVTANRVITIPDATTTLVGKTGTAVANQIPFYSDSTQLTTDANFTRNPSTGEISSLFNQNTGTTIRVTNNSTGTAALAQYILTAGSGGFVMALYGSSYATNGLLSAGLSQITTGTVAGLLYSSTNVSGKHVWSIGGTGTVNEYMRLTTTSLTLADSVNITTNATTGSKIGNGGKIGLFDAAPIARPTTAVAAATLVSNAGTALTSTDTIDGYTILQVVKALRNLGALT